jgi:hypothetical protein
MATMNKNLIPDLHDPSLDVAGRVDILAARLLKMAVGRVQDPAILAIYQTLQPAVDTLLHVRLSSVDCAKLFTQIGLAPPDQLKPNHKPRRKRRSKVVMP